MNGRFRTAGRDALERLGDSPVATAGVVAAVLAAAVILLAVDQKTTATLADPANAPELLAAAAAVSMARPAYPAAVVGGLAVASYLR